MQLGQAREPFATLPLANGAADAYNYSIVVNTEEVVDAVPADVIHNTK